MGDRWAQPKRTEARVGRRLEPRWGPRETLAHGRESSSMAADFMRIGLIRHFPVNHPMPAGWMTAAEIHAWRQRYDETEVTVVTVELGTTTWERCLSSDLERAYVTAKAVFAGEIERTPLLREPHLAEFRTGALRLPPSGWRWALRLAWLTGHRSQRAARDDFARRVKAVADLFESDERDTLVVSHAGMMAFLRRELMKRGFVGPKFGTADHGRLYVFERKRVETVALGRGTHFATKPVA